MAQMIFVPMTRDEAQALRSGTGAGDYQGCAATPTLAASMEPDSVPEEVEYVALSNAGVLALVVKPNAPRLVVAAEGATGSGDRSRPAGRGGRGSPAGVGSSAGAFRRRT